MFVHSKVKRKVPICCTVDGNRMGHISYVYIYIYISLYVRHVQLTPGISGVITIPTKTKQSTITCKSFALTMHLNYLTLAIWEIPVGPREAVPEASKRREYDPEGHVPIESFVTTASHFPLPTHQIVHSTTLYYKVLRSTTPYYKVLYSSTTKHYSVVLQNITLFFKVLHKTSPY